MVIKNRSYFGKALLLALVLFVAAGCSSKEEKISSFVGKGDGLMTAGDPTRAAIEYKNALQIDPQNTAAILGLGNALLAQAQYQKAYSLFNSALSVNPDLDEARLQVAWILALGRQSDRALEELARIKDAEKYRHRTDLIRAIAFFAVERYREASDILSQVEGNKNDKTMQMLLAHSLKALKAWDSMEKAAERWRALDPKDPGPYLFIARIAAESGDQDRVVGELRQMVDVDPGDLRKAVLEAKTLESFGLLKQAEAVYERLPDVAETLIAKADFWTRRGNNEKTHAVLLKLIETSPEDVDAVIRLVRLLLDTNELSSAAELLDKRLKTASKKSDREKLLLAKAILESKQARWAEATTLCETVLKENQGNIEAHFLLGKILLGANKPKDAEIHLNQAATSRPEDEQAQILLAKCQLLNNKEPLAFDTLKKALEINPKSTVLRMELILYHLGKKEFDQVARIIEKGLEIQPDNITLLKLRGGLESSLKEYGKAEKSFQRIVELKRDSPLGYMEMGRLMLDQSKLNEALGWFQKAMDKENGWQDALPAVIKVYLLKKEPKSALAVIADENKKHPESGLIQYYLGQTLDATGDLKGAEASFSKSIELSPSWIAPYGALAAMYLRQGEIDKAISQIEEAYHKNPSHASLVQLAMLYDYAGRYEDAIRVYNEVLASSDAWPEIMNNLAFLYAEHSSDAQALAKASDLAARALSRQPDNPFFLDTAAWIAYKRGEIEAARYNILAALASAPAEGLHNLHAALILRQIGNGQGALEYLDKAIQLGDPQLRERAAALKKEWGASGGQ